jgi:hypothetical protein
MNKLIIYHCCNLLSHSKRTNAKTCDGYSIVRNYKSLKAGPSGILQCLMKVRCALVTRMTVASVIEKK